MIYKSCRELPLFIFNEIFETNDYSLLVKDGKYTDEEINDSWKNILEEYDDLSKTFSSKKQYKDRCEIVFLQTKLSFLRIAFILDQIDISIENEAKLKDILKRYNVKDLKKEISSTENLLNLKTTDFERVYEAEKKDKKSLDYAIVRVSKHLGMHINKFVITVSEWIETIRMIEQQKGQNG